MSDDSNKKKRRVVTKKDTIEHPNMFEFVVTFDDGGVEKAFKHKSIYSAASHERFLLFVRECKEGDMWEDENGDEDTFEAKDNNTSDKIDK